MVRDGTAFKTRGTQACTSSYVEEVETDLTCRTLSRLYESRTSLFLKPTISDKSTGRLR